MEFPAQNGREIVDWNYICIYIYIYIHTYIYIYMYIFMYKYIYMYIFTPDKDTSFLTKWECALAPQNGARSGPCVRVLATSLISPCIRVLEPLLSPPLHRHARQVCTREKERRERGKRRWCRPKTGFAAKSGQNMKNRTFSNL